MTTVSPFPAGSVKGRLLQHLLRSKNDPSYFNQRPKTRLELPIFTLATNRAPESCVVIVVMRFQRF